MAQSVSQITLPGRSLPGGVVSGVIAEHCDLSQWISFLQDACTSPGNKKTMRCRYCIKSVLSVGVTVLSIAGTVLSVVIVVIVVTALSVARLETSQSRLTITFVFVFLHTQYPIAVTVLSVAVTVLSRLIAPPDPPPPRLPGPRAPRPRHHVNLWKLH